MTALWNEELAIALALPILLVVTQAVHTVSHRYRTYTTTQCIARIAAMIVAHEEPDNEAIERLRIRFSNDTILNAAIFISQHIYGRATHRLSLILEECEIDLHLRKLLKHQPRNGQRALLSALSQLSAFRSAVEYADYGIDSANTFDTAIAFAATRPEQAIRHIANIKTPLSLYEVALLAQMIHRAGAPIAYTPLLLSENRNLQLIGINLCESFAIVDAEPHLQALTASLDQEIAIAALFALCSLRGDLATTQVKAGMARLAPHLRGAFIRHALRSCYSLRSCVHLLSKEEALRFSQRIASYKSRIICN